MTGVQTCALPISLYKQSIKGKIIKSQDLAKNMAKFISETSILSEIAPGLRTSLILCKIESQTIIIMEKKYKIVDGTLFYVLNSGRMLKHNYMVNHVSNFWVLKDEAGIHISGIPALGDETPEWWKNFVTASEQSVARMSHKESFVYDTENSMLLYSQKKGEITSQSGNIGFIENRNNYFLKFQPIHLWAVPMDKRGNIFIRIRANIEIGNKKGFGIIELPCNFIAGFEKKYPLTIKMERNKNSITFFCDEIPVLNLVKPLYL